MTKDRLIRDPIYDYITLPADVAGIVDHPLFQRLRRVAQISLTASVYPTSTGTRFEHGVNGHVDVVAGGRGRSSLVAIESPRGQFVLSAPVVRWVRR